ncbi:MAG: methionyl-tRNA formyltransferase [Thermodesulfobacteriota bacterium]
MSTPSWRIVFFGTPSFALPPLEKLTQGPDEVIAVVTQPDREKGRGRKRVPPPVKAFALQRGLRIFQPEKIKEAAFLETLKGFEADLFVVAAYGQIFPKVVLSLPRHGAVNIHASLLPKYRGSAPIAWAILNGEQKTGITTMLMDEGMDTGDILLQSEISVSGEDTTETLQNRLASLGAQVLSETLEKLKRGEIHPVPQDHSKATYAPMLKKEDGRVQWTKRAEEIDRQVRAFHPWPGAYTEWQGHLLKIYKGEVREGKETGKPGTVLWVGADFIEIETGKDSYLLKEVQLEGKRRMSVRDFLLGHTVSVGEVLR